MGKLNIPMILSEDQETVTYSSTEPYGRKLKGQPMASSWLPDDCGGTGGPPIYCARQHGTLKTSPKLYRNAVAKKAAIFSPEAYALGCAEFITSVPPMFCSI